VRSFHVVTLLLAAGLLAACGDSGDDGTSATSAAVTGQPTTAAEATSAAEPRTAADATTTTEATTAAGAGTVDVDYRSGSVPPPYNYELTLHVEVGGDAATADYALTYRYRDALPDDSTEPVDEDVQWSGAVDDATADLARGLVADPALTGTVDENAVGGDSWDVSVTPDGEDAQTGVPADPDRYRALICAVDAQARQAPGATKAQNGPC
jgi:hypothetical protein